MQSNEVLGRAPLIPTLRRLGILPTRFLVTVNVGPQRMCVWRKARALAGQFPDYKLVRESRVSTSKFGIGQTMNSNCTPLGLHRIAKKTGGGHPQGTVF